MWILVSIDMNQQGVKKKMAGAQICSNSSTMHFFFIKFWKGRINKIIVYSSTQRTSDSFWGEQGEGEGCNGFEKREVLGLGIKWRGGGVGGFGEC